MKKIGTILCLLLLTFLLEGCRMVKIKEADREPLNYTVVEKQQLPEEAAALIEENKEKEFQMAMINRKLNPDLDSLFLTAEHQFMYLSSSAVKEMGHYGADLSDFLPHEIMGEFYDRIRNTVK